MEARLCSGVGRVQRAGPDSGIGPQDLVALSTLALGRRTLSHQVLWWWQRWRGHQLESLVLACGEEGRVALLERTDGFGVVRY